jgi:branched-chain amino acid transport system permease protein
MLTLDLLINGLIIGVFYALMAIGLSLIFGILKIVNFAHGEFYMVGAYAYTLSALSLGISPWLALPFALVVGLLLGLTVERLLMRPLYSGYTSWGVMRDEYAVIVTFALSIFLINIVDKIVGPYAFKGPPLVHISRITVGPLAMSGHRLVAALIAIAVIVIVALIIRYTFWGRQIQAVSQTASAPRSPASTRRKQAPSSSRWREASPPFPARFWPTSSTPRPISAFSPRSNPT